VVRTPSFWSNALPRQLSVMLSHLHDCIQHARRLLQLLVPSSHNRSSSPVHHLHESLRQLLCLAQGSTHLVPNHINNSTALSAATFNGVMLPLTVKSMRTAASEAMLVSSQVCSSSQIRCRCSSCASSGRLD
jgi:hypothetical protein